MHMSIQLNNLSDNQRLVFSKRETMHRSIYLLTYNRESQIDR